MPVGAGRQGRGRAAVILAAAALLWAGAGPGGASMNRFWLASQHDWGAKRGFYLDFENDSQGEARCRLEGLRMFLGVADGQEWRFVPTGRRRWQLDREYRVRAVIAPGQCELYLDGRLVGRSPGSFAPHPGKLAVGETPYWANGPADYLVLESSARLQSGERRLELPLPARPLPLHLFEPNAHRQVAWQPDPRQPLVIEATFRLVRTPDLRALAPLVDRYGQCAYADWPGKVKSDQDLALQAREEEARLAAWGRPEGYDRFGGYRPAGFGQQASGYYRVMKRDGFWWLVSPEGNPCFYLGICTAPALTWDQTPVSGREFLFAWLPGSEAPGWGENPWGPDPGIRYLAPHTANMVRKYGPDWQARSMELTARRLKAWGFSGIGKWGGMADTPYLPVLSRAGVPNLVKHPDVFDPAVQARFREVLGKQVLPQRENPWVVGWTVGSEVDEIIYRGEVAQVLQGPDCPGKRALVDHVCQQRYGGDLAALARAWGAAGSTALYGAKLEAPPADLELARRHYADRYYELAYRTVKELDPNHLYLGNYMIPGAWENEEDWLATARHCDVFGYDLYSDQFADPWFAALIAKAGKPVICGEFAYPAWYGGRRGFGRYPIWAEDDAASGDAYRRWLQAATANPYCVGASWFQYRDQPLTGRGPGHGQDLVYGEHFAFGFVDLTDRPKWDFVTRVRAANLQAAKWRLEASKKPGR